MEKRVAGYGDGRALLIDFFSPRWDISFVIMVGLVWLGSVWVGLVCELRSRGGFTFAII